MELSAASRTHRHFRAGDVIANPGLFKDCYVICSGVMSVQYGSAAVEVGLLGPGNIINLGAILGTDEIMHSVIAVTECDTIEIATPKVRVGGLGRPDFERLISRYLHSRFNQTMALAACHARHSVEQRLATWVVAATDMLGQPQIRVTHQQLSKFLGVQRSTATVALEILEGRQVIWSRRGRVIVRDAPRLAECGCGCLGKQEPSAAFLEMIGVFSAA